MSNNVILFLNSDVSTIPGADDNLHDLGRCKKSRLQLIDSGISWIIREDGWSIAALYGTVFSKIAAIRFNQSIMAFETTIRAIPVDFSCNLLDEKGNEQNVYVRTSRTYN